jgi:hypothetical protein
MFSDVANLALSATKEPLNAENAEDAENSSL